jgi:hypothetical protein
VGAVESGPGLREAAGLIEVRSVEADLVDGRAEDSGPLVLPDAASALDDDAAALALLAAALALGEGGEGAFGACDDGAGGMGSALVPALDVGAVDGETAPGRGGGFETRTRGGDGECEGEGGDGASALAPFSAFAGRGGSGAFGATGAPEPFICAVSSAPARASASARMSLPSSSAASAPR